MKILLVNDPYIPVPPKGYGGIERVVELLAIQFNKMGHHVNLLAGPNSYVKDVVTTTYGKNNFPPSKKDKLISLIAVWQFLWKNRRQYDLVVNFGRLVYLLPILNAKTNKISCYQREITTKNVLQIFQLPHKHLKISGCSLDLIRRSRLESECTFIHNCVDFAKYNLVDINESEAPLIFLGRLERIKGVHTAIEVAKRTNNKLIIAGNISPLKEERQYYENEIRPLIDGKQISYVGQVDDVQKNHYLGKAKGFLFPIEWEEPFGIVMVEAMACGTPVIGFGRGAVTEVIDNGVTGFVVDDVEEMIEKVLIINGINRRRCKELAKERFDVSVIAEKYINLFSS